MDQTIHQLNQYLGGQGASALFIVFSFALNVAAYLLRDILKLRVLAVLSSLCMITAAFVAPSDYLSVSAFTHGVLASINVVQSAILVRERMDRTFTGEERRLKDSVFAALDDFQVKKLFDYAEWVNYEPGSVLTDQDHEPISLWLTAEGSAEVEVDGAVVAGIGDGEFIGEMSFLENTAAGATVIVKTPSRYLMWRRPRLKRICEKDSEIRDIIFSAIGADMARKINRLNRNVWLNEARS